MRGPGRGQSQDGEACHIESIEAIEIDSHFRKTSVTVFSAIGYYAKNILFKRRMLSNSSRKMYRGNKGVQKAVWQFITKKRIEEEISGRIQRGNKRAGQSAVRQKVRGRGRASRGRNNSRAIARPEVGHGNTAEARIR